ncbi:unnamed protein product [Didymodactylos carnosus]|uniref:Pseudouridine synthase I TruA alpha/beta domain-containing protein n=1 Tax=Didymodactylos carnosus TaxID=1234261 RepID=A0A8S2E0Z0_9BILA|nr:unnamed protein product [Didymodactylos carnosus]CAF3824698.1 unnamed protein product [Didymodactylos carnosus]
MSKKRKLLNDPSEDKWNSLSREDLIDRCKQLETHVHQLRNVLAKVTNQSDKNNFKNGTLSSSVDNVSIDNTDSNPSSKKKKAKELRPFDFSRYNKRHIFLKLVYLGWEYEGFVTQEHTSQTVEKFLFDALIRTRLIESRETSNYHRCGRTDRGVSAFTQVISLTVRSNKDSGKGVTASDNKKESNSDDELQYARMLNSVLPDTIRILAWSPVEQAKSARFDCISRSYRYYFPKADLDLDLMRDAAKLLIGIHDFRSFCKLDIGNNVVTFIRQIYDVKIDLLDGTTFYQDNPGYQMCELIVSGSGFLWHQIRCVVAILIAIGQKKEEVQLVSDLLDIEKHPCKPHYVIASELPLVLFDCQFEDVEWLYDEKDSLTTIRYLQRHWTSYQVRSTMLSKMLETLEKTYYSTISRASEPILGQLSILENPQTLFESTKKPYLPILQRQTRSSIEQSVDNYIKRKRLDCSVQDFLNKKHQKEKGTTLTVTKEDEEEKTNIPSTNTVYY